MAESIEKVNSAGCYVDEATFIELWKRVCDLQEREVKLWSGNFILTAFPARTVTLAVLALVHRSPLVRGWPCCPAGLVPSFVLLVFLLPPPLPPPRLLASRPSRLPPAHLFLPPRPRVRTCNPPLLHVRTGLAVLKEVPFPACVVRNMPAAHVALHATRLPAQAQQTPGS